MTSSIDYNQMLENQMQEIKHLRECIDNLDKENTLLKEEINELKIDRDNNGYDSDNDSVISIDE